MSATATAEKPHLEPVPDSDEKTEDLVVKVGGQLSLKVGGKAADQSTVLLSGGEVKLDGQFDKGERVKFVIEGVVSQVAFTDLMDQKTGAVTATKRKHTLKLDSVERV